MIIKKRTILVLCQSFSAGKYDCFLDGLSTIFKHVLLIWATHHSDWNGSKRGHIYKFLRSQGFESSYDIAHQYTDADEHKVNIF